MKKTGLITIIAFIISCSLQAQNDFSGNLAEAKSSYNSGDLENARFALQQSLVELDKIIGAEILKLLPTQLLGTNFDEKDDNVTGSSLGYTGVYVHRSYPSENLRSNIEIITNSPFLSMVTSYLTNPLLQGIAGDSNQKVVKIQGYKSLITKNEGEGNTTYEIQIPISDSLITLSLEGVRSENEAVGAANTLNIQGIAKLIKGN